MQYLKISVFSFILLLVASLTVSGQSAHTRYELLRFRVQPGQEQAFIYTQAKTVQHYRSACELPWRIYVLSDHTFELVLPVSEGKEQDCPTSGIARYYTELKTVPGVVIDEPTQPLYQHSDLSYASAALADNKYPDSYYEVITYRVPVGQWDQAMEHLQQLAIISRKMDSPLTFTCYTQGGEAAANTFKLVYAAEDPDDLAERREIHESKAPGALQHWRNKLALMTEVEQVVTGHYVYELSQQIDQELLGVNSSGF